MNRWYNRLIGEKSLLSNLKYTPGGDNIIIARKLEYINFRMFKDHIELIKFMKKIKTTEPEKMCFYEVIFGDERRKPYFDIDVKEFSKEEADNIIRKIVGNIRGLIPDIDNFGTIYVYKSHAKEKLSYHIVVDGWCLANNKESKEFYERTIENLSYEEQQIVDKAVYSSLQQFRILGCHKYGKTNTKVIDKELTYNMCIPKGVNKEIYIITASLITRCNECRALKGFEGPEEELKEYSTGASSENDTKDALKLFYAKYEKRNFKVMEAKVINGNLLITLRTLHPYKCNICLRVHEHENPFIMVIGQERDVYFDCRRRNKQKMEVLGSLGLIIEEQEEEIHVKPRNIFKVARARDREN